MKNKRNVLEALANKDIYVFFRNANDKDDTSYDNSNYVYHSGKSLILRDEYQKEVDNLSLTEIASLFNSSKKDLKTIKKWLSFFGILTIGGILMALLYLATSL